LEPLSVFISGNHAQYPNGTGRSAITAWLPLHQDEFDIVFYHRIRFIRFSQETATAIFDFISGIRDFVPDYWSKIVKAILRQ